MKKKVILSFIFILMVSLLSGCSIGDDAIRDEILVYMKDKYNGQEFVALSLEGTYYGKVLHCYPKGGDPEVDNVKVERSKKGEYRDTYFGIIIREDFENEVASVSSIGMPMKVFDNQTTIYHDNQFDRTKTYADLKEWMAKGNSNRFNATIFVSTSVTSGLEKYANQIINKLEQAKLSGLYYIIFVPDSIYNKIKRANIDEVLKEHESEIIHGVNRFEISSN